MARVLLVVAQFYEDLASQLVQGACHELHNLGMDYDTVNVPGTLEIPAAISFSLQHESYDGYIALGCVIRGETSHYDVVCQSVTAGINHLVLTHKLPLGFGVITAENMEQAANRADPSLRNYGGKAARACIEMMKLKAHWSAI
ncbi:MAG: 6,7-dimethyl-8-ribityllumazine synthase [Alphaproteobacteria bacterium]|nr:6,7-dimethyl-8-ribityllumazine synthase [Alphaproteobacteria bacterium]